MSKKIRKAPVAGFLVKLKEITDKDISALTVSDVEFLKARRQYLNKKQRGIYKEILRSKVKVTKADTKKEVPYKELQRQAKALGYPYVGISRADLEVSISTGVGPQDA